MNIRDFNNIQGISIAGTSRGFVQKSNTGSFAKTDNFNASTNEDLNLIDPAKITIKPTSSVDSLKASDYAGKSAAVALEAALGIAGSPAKAFPGMLQALQIKDDYTRWHVKRVADYSRDIAKALGLPSSEVNRIHKAAVLHDIGKIRTPDDILKKPGKLDDDEFKIMRQHAAEGRNILSQLKGGVDKKILDYVGYHHERWDGKGYPDGLKGDRIPIGAQVIAVADTYDAMTSDRPYRKGMPGEEALSLMAQGSGTQFSPVVLKKFLEIMGHETAHKTVGSTGYNAAHRTVGSTGYDAAHRTVGSTGYDAAHKTVGSTGYDAAHRTVGSTGGVSLN